MTSDKSSFLRPVVIALALAISALVVVALWKLGGLLVFIGLFAFVANLATDSLHLNPKIGFAVIAVLFTGAWYLFRHFSSLGSLRYFVLGGALTVLSIGAYFFSDPDLRRLSPPYEPCFGVFGEPRCYLPIDAVPSEETPLYQIATGYQVRGGTLLFDESGRELRIATAIDLTRLRLDFKRVFSLGTGDCFASSGEPRCFYRIIDADGGNGYAIYRATGSMDTRLLRETIYDREGRELKLLTLEIADRIRQWEVQDPTGPLRLSSH